MENNKKNLDNLINEKVDGEKIKGGMGTLGADGGMGDPMQHPHEHEQEMNDLHANPHENEIDGNADVHQDPMAPTKPTLGGTPTLG